MSSAPVGTTLSPPRSSVFNAFTSCNSSLANPCVPVPKFSTQSKTAVSTVWQTSNPVIIGLTTDFTRPQINKTIDSPSALSPLPKTLAPIVATGLLSSGFVGGLFAGGLWLKNGIATVSPSITKANAINTTGTVKQALGSLKYETSFIYGNAGEGLASLLQLATMHSQFHKPLLAYLGASVIGYLVGTLAQGIQESFIRRQEASIRGQLVSRLKTAFGNSIQHKQAMDAQLRQSARQYISRLLQDTHTSITPELSLLLRQHGGILPLPTTLANQLDDRSVAEATYVNAPQDRRLSFAGQATPEPTHQYPIEVSSSSAFSPAGLGALALGTGTGLGLLTQQLFNALLKSAPAKHATDTVSNKIAVYAYNTEAAFLSRNKTLLGGLFLVSALAKGGKLLVDALREVEVTRQNAETELAYQTHNWTSIDPDFHWIAESAALQQELTQFAEDLPLLRQQPNQLTARVQSVISNRGRSSPPAYYSATPPVMLTEAKG
jgi:hypothetical protein